MGLFRPTDVCKNYLNHKVALLPRISAVKLYVGWNRWEKTTFSYFFKSLPQAFWGTIQIEIFIVKRPFCLIIETKWKLSLLEKKLRKKCGGRGNSGLLLKIKSLPYIPPSSFSLAYIYYYQVEGGCTCFIQHLYNLSTPPPQSTFYCPIKDIHQRE